MQLPRATCCLEIGEAGSGKTASAAHRFVPQPFGTAASVFRANSCGLPIADVIGEKVHNVIKLDAVDIIAGEPADAMDTTA